MEKLTDAELNDRVNRLERYLEIKKRCMETEDRLQELKTPHITQTITGMPVFHGGEDGTQKSAEREIEERQKLQCLASWQ